MSTTLTHMSTGDSSSPSSSSQLPQLPHISTESPNGVDLNNQAAPQHAAQEARGARESSHEPLATELHSIADATLTIRVIKSFEFRTQKSLVLRGLDLRGMTVGQLMDRVREEIKKQSGFKPYRTLQLDTMKIYTVAHGHKTMNLIINLDHDDWILDPERILADFAENETELSFFNRESYEKFKMNPEIKWQ